LSKSSEISKDRAMAHRVYASDQLLPLHRVFVSDDDAAAACKVLQLLAAARQRAGPADDRQERAVGSDERSLMRDRAHEALVLRERRMEALSFSAEVPFILMVALYVHEEQEPAITQTRLCQLAWVGNSTTLRWLETLVSEGLIDRTADPADGRKVLLSLSPKGRSSLDGLFAEPSRAFS